MGRRRRARQLAVQVLFHLGFNPGYPEDTFGLICRNFDIQESDFAKALVVGVSQCLEELDRLIREASKNWRLERMPMLDKCILRMAVYELLYLEDVPPKVTIDEAVEIGKRFGSQESGSFINGVLDKIYSSLLAQGRLRQKAE